MEEDHHDKKRDKRWTPERLALLSEALEAKKSKTEIAALMGLSVSRVYQAIREYLPQHSKSSQDDILDARISEAAADRPDIPTTELVAHVQNAGVDRSGNSIIHRYAELYPDRITFSHKIQEILPQLYTMFSQDISIGVVTAQLNISWSTASRAKALYHHQSALGRGVVIENDGAVGGLPDEIIQRIFLCHAYGMTPEEIAYVLNIDIDEVDECLVD